MPPLAPSFAPRFDVAPYRLSGAVYVALLNHRDALASLGDAVSAPPYRGAPKGVVLAVRPRNTLAAALDGAAIDDAGAELEVEGMLGLVIGTTACDVAAADALDHVAGYLVVAAFSVPRAGHFRPQVPSMARDASCVLGPAVVHARAGFDADALAVRVLVDGVAVRSSRTSDHVRGAARLLADVSDFMTLAPGDVLLTGGAPGPARVRAGQRIAIEVDGVGRLETHVAARVGEPA